MSGANKSSESVVKIDSKLLGEVEEFINKEKNRIIYANKKQFIDIAVLEKLKKEAKK